MGDPETVWLKHGSVMLGLPEAGENPVQGLEETPELGPPGEASANQRRVRKHAGKKFPLPNSSTR